MRKGFLSTVVYLLAGAGFAVAEPPAVSPTPKPMEPAAAAAPAAADAGAASLTTSDCTSGNACNACDGCDGCNQCGGRVWADADFLLWWIRDSHTPALVTTGSTANAFPGALGQSGTRTLFGGDIDNDTRAGARFDVGTWLNDDDTLGVGADFLFLGHRSVNFNAFSLGSPILARPFLNASLGSERAFLIAFPNSQAGAVNASLSSRLWGGELDARAEVAHNETGRVDVLAGFRHLELIENLDIANATLFTAPNPVFGGLNIQSVDHFGAGNFFYGGEIGADSVFENGPLSLRLLGKVAFGNMHEIVNVSGATSTTTLTGVTSNIRTGQLVQQTNTGRFTRDELAVVPELGVTLGYALARNVHATVGYTFLYASDVARPGDQVDRSVNVTQIPPPIGAGTLIGPARPAFAFNNTDFWAQGVNLGLEFRY